MLHAWGASANSTADGYSFPDPNSDAASYSAAQHFAFAHLIPNVASYLRAHFATNTPTQPRPDKPASDCSSDTVCVFRL